jgi:hypothetical protein
MPASHAHIPTSRAIRYLTQLCNHGSLMGRLARHRPTSHGGGGGGSPVVTVASSGTEGVIDFGWGRCTVHAAVGTLTVHAEAGDPLQLRQIQDGITARLQRIGRRDQLAVSWTPGPPAEEPDHRSRT